MRFLSLFTLVFLTGLQARAVDTVYDYINTPAFRARAEDFYKKQVESDVVRSKIIAQAKDDCGGRYEGTQISFVELSHAIEVGKDVIHTNNPNNYQLVFDSSAKTAWLAVETITCSLHGGHSRSVLKSIIVKGIETMKLTYTYVNDKQVGKAKISDIKREFSMYEPQLEKFQSAPYDSPLSN